LRSLTLALETWIPVTRLNGASQLGHISLQLNDQLKQDGFALCLRFEATQGISTAAGSFNRASLTGCGLSGTPLTGCGLGGPPLTISFRCSTNAGFALC